MRTKYWIFDTNSLLSALLNEDSPPGRALKIARQTGILLVSAETSAEYFTVFCRPKSGKYLSLEIRLSFIENIISAALAVEINKLIIACRDPKDNMFLSLAISAGADAIITGDKDLLILHPFRNIPVLSPSDFLNNF